METEEGKPSQENKKGDSNNGDGDSVDDDAMTRELKRVFKFFTARENFFAFFFDFF